MALYYIWILKKLFSDFSEYFDLLKNLTRVEGRVGVGFISSNPLVITTICTVDKSWYTLLLYKTVVQPQILGLCIFCSFGWEMCSTWPPKARGVEKYKLLRLVLWQSNEVSYHLCQHLYFHLYILPSCPSITSFT